jgi:hypothetical protein
MDIGGVVWGVMTIVLVIVVLVGRRARRKGGALRGGVVGANYEWLSHDKRQAAEYILEDRAEARDAEDADGNLPDLERPRGPSGNW